MNLTKMMILFLVVVVGGLVTAGVDQVLGLNQTFNDMGSLKSITHKVVYMMQGIAIWLAVTWKND